MVRGWALMQNDCSTQTESYQKVSCQRKSRMGQGHISSVNRAGPESSEPLYDVRALVHVHHFQAQLHQHAFGAGRQPVQHGGDAVGQQSQLGMDEGASAGAAACAGLGRSRRQYGRLCRRGCLRIVPAEVQAAAFVAGLG